MAQEAHHPDQKRTLAALTYVVFLLPLLAGANKDRFVHYHFVQAMGLVLVALALQGIISLTGYWSYALDSAFLGSLKMLVLWLVRFFLLYLVLMGAKTAVAGETKPLPWIGEYAIKLFA